MTTEFYQCGACDAGAQAWRRAGGNIGEATAELIWIWVGSDNSSTSEPLFNDVEVGSAVKEWYRDVSFLSQSTFR